MTPRNFIVWIDQADPPDEVRRKIISSPHTRFPVCDQSLDNLLGIVQVKDLLVQDLNVEPFRIKGRLTLPLFLYEGTRGLKILEMFKTSGSRVAVVLDEYGTVEGLLTLTDILEALVGDMPVGDEEDEPAAVQREDGSWLLDGRLALDEFRDLFALATTPAGDFHTLAGLVSPPILVIFLESAKVSKVGGLTSRSSTWTVTASIASSSNVQEMTAAIRKTVNPSHPASPVDCPAVAGAACRILGPPRTSMRAFLHRLLVVSCIMHVSEDRQRLKWLILTPVVLRAWANIPGADRDRGGDLVRETRQPTPIPAMRERCAARQPGYRSKRSRVPARPARRW